MKFLRFRAGKVEKTGVLIDGKIRRVLGSMFGEYTVTDEIYEEDEVHILPPVLPSKVVCVARNYAAHAKELGNEVPEEPLIFLKPSTAVIGHEDTVIYPEDSKQVDHEGELGVIIGRRASHVAAKDAENYIFGYTVLNDFTARDLQKKEGKFTRAKSFDTFCPMGPFIETELDTKNIRIRTLVNGVAKQDGTTEQMIFDIPTLIAFISRVMTLLPGDVIATGTPPGVGPVEPGDVVEVEIPEIGTLRNYVHKR